MEQTFFGEFVAVNCYLIDGFLMDFLELRANYRQVDRSEHDFIVDIFSIFLKLEILCCQQQDWNYIQILSKCIIRIFDVDSSYNWHVHQ